MKRVIIFIDEHRYERCMEQINSLINEMLPSEVWEVSQDWELMKSGEAQRWAHCISDDVACFVPFSVDLSAETFELLISIEGKIDSLMGQALLDWHHEGGASS
jgi:hypothetical protein